MFWKIIVIISCLIVGSLAHQILGPNNLVERFGERIILESLGFRHLDIEKDNSKQINEQTSS